jgi:iron complex outermembrane receptor protein
LIGGLRHERERNRSASHFDDEALTVTSARYTATLPKLGMSFEPTEDHLFGAVVQCGYRGGASAFNIAEQKAVAFGPEYSLTRS